MPKRILILHQGTYMLPKSNGGALPDNDQAALLRQLRAEPRSLNYCSACHTQASQVSAWPGDQSRSGLLKGMINLSPETR